MSVLLMSGLLPFLILLLPSQLALHFWPKFAYFGQIPVDYLSPAVYLTEILTLLLIIVSLPVIKFRFSSPALMVLVLINIFLSQIPGLTFFKYLKIAILFLLYHVLQRHPRLFLSSVYRFWPLTVIWVSILAILQFIHKSNLGGWWYWVGERNLSLSTPDIAGISLGNLGYFLRSYATLPHPNSLAAFLILATIFLYGIRKHLDQTHFYLAIGLSTVAVIFTFSRHAIFSLFISGLITGFPLTLSLFLLLLCLVLFTVGYSTTVYDRTIQLFALVDVIKSKLLFGVGFGVYPAASSGVQLPFRDLRQMLSPIHNTYLLLIAELGIILFVVWFRHLVKYLNYLLVYSEKWFKTAILFVFISSFFDHYWVTSVQNTFLLFIITAYVRVKYNYHN